MDTQDDIQRARFVMESYIGYQMPEKTLAELAEILVRQCECQETKLNSFATASDKYRTLVVAIGQLFSDVKADI